MTALTFAISLLVIIFTEYNIILFPDEFYCNKKEKRARTRIVSLKTQLSWAAYATPFSLGKWQVRQDSPAVEYISPTVVTIRNLLFRLDAITDLVEP